MKPLPSGVTGQSTQHLDLFETLQFDSVALAKLNSFIVTMMFMYDMQVKCEEVENQFSVVQS